MKFALKSRVFALFIDVVVALTFSSIFCASFWPSISMNPTISKLVFQSITILSFVLKDTFGRSIGKVICGLRIVDKAGRTPELWKRLLRNVSCIVWFVELRYMFGEKDGIRLLDRKLQLYIDFS